jgi:hypothetical protein
MWQYYDILTSSVIDPNEWLFQAFFPVDDCFKYFFKDPIYVGKNICITWQIHHQCKLFLDVNPTTVKG